MALLFSALACGLFRKGGSYLHWLCFFFAQAVPQTPNYSESRGFVFLKMWKLRRSLGIVDVPYLKIIFFKNRLTVYEKSFMKRFFEALTNP
jgi:hypothetical protein